MSNPSATVYSKAKKEAFALFLFSLGASFLLIVTLSAFLFSVLFGADTSVVLLLIFTMLIAFAAAVYLSKITLSSLFLGYDALQRMLDETTHELGTPIATIKANAQMLKENGDEKTVARVERIEKASQRLLTLHTQLGYKIRREVRMVKQELFWLDELVRTTAQQLDELFAQQSIELTLDLSPTAVTADRIGAEGAVANLLSNALKYNKPNGFVRVTIKDAILCIEDGGIGISEERTVRIFDRYYQADPSTHGSGLGLTIVKGFCDENGVTITLKSAPNEGSRFCLDFRGILGSQ